MATKVNQFEEWNNLINQKSVDKDINLYNGNLIRGLPIGKALNSTVSGGYINIAVST